MIFAKQCDRCDSSDSHFIKRGQRENSKRVLWFERHKRHTVTNCPPTMAKKEQ